MNYTSAEASKLLRKLNDDHDALLEDERRCSNFLAAMGEDVESLRPEYDYSATQEKLAVLEEKIRLLKHTINVFNVTHTVPGFGTMTIDRMLVYIPQLTRRKNKLADMKNRLAKARESADSYGRPSNIIDYRYVNYDIAQAVADYDKVSDELARAQTALDLVNSTETMKIDL